MDQKGKQRGSLFGDSISQCPATTASIEAAYKNASPFTKLARRALESKTHALRGGARGQRQVSALRTHLTFCAKLEVTTVS